MFDLSFAEIALILLVAVIFIGPKDIPVVIRAVSRFVRTIKGWAREIRAAFDDMAKESGLKDMADEFEGDVRMIRGDDGKWYESYDIHKTSSPLVGEERGGGAKDEPKPS
ncbi:MAG: Sec-independent protein translocase protein TatB [Rickettsiales bacterium]|jgi:Tat protein translocase TatB subunit|nr:Sec-independent protein translocase protein TatB [Rickettsiales bacterium]